MGNLTTWLSEDLQALLGLDQSMPLIKYHDHAIGYVETHIGVHDDAVIALADVEIAGEHTWYLGRYEAVPTPSELIKEGNRIDAHNIEEAVSAAIQDINTRTEDSN